jgi:taurine dioxygenase
VTNIKNALTYKEKTMTATAQKYSDIELATKPLTPCFGVEILDFDATTASAMELAAFDAICRSNSVVVLRNQTLSAAQVVRLSSRLGRLSSQHRDGPHPDHPEISILSNKKSDGKLIGIHGIGRNWHTDGTTYKVLGLTTMLYGVECPPEGGDTLLADTAAAFAALPPERQTELEKVQVVHSRAVLINKYKKFKIDENAESMKDVIHPIVVTSPVDGSKALFLTKGSTKGIVGMDDDAAMALMSELIEFATQPQFVYRHTWKAGDVLIWNDLSTVHTATDFDDSKYDRIVYRAWARPYELVNQTTAEEEIGPAH